jgi:Protein of unknown function (DUF3616)
VQIKTPTPLLQFQNPPKKLTKSLSAAVFAGDDLWVASDETTSVERLSTDDGLTFQHHRSFPLQGLINLPAHGSSADQEIDIEGLDYHDSCLWLVGSHSIKRKKVEPTDDGSDAKLIGKLGKIEAEGNRFILARVPLIKNVETGEMELVRESPPGSNPILKASQLPGDMTSDALIDAITKAEKDEELKYLSIYRDIPGKDGGLDIEGLAVKGEKVFVGLRGPVLRGWAVILELSVDTSDSSRLGLKEFESNRSYRKHFLDLRGLGVRELSIQGSDLLVLAGPTMVLDGRTILYRWKDALKSNAESVVRGDQLVDMKISFGTGHAEGIAIVPESGPPSQLLVVYDSPGEERIKGDAVTADVFPLPNR